MQLILRRVLLQIVLFISVLELFTTTHNKAGTALDSLQHVEDLDSLALFSFAIMGDNQGLEARDNLRMARMTKWIDDSGDAFVIGTGDHISEAHGNGFLSFIRQQEWWHRNFYPIASDAENDYYGTGQDDWGAGRCLFDEIGLHERPGVSFHNNGVEYYAPITVKGYTIHFIALHYPDQPEDEAIAFPEESREYLAQTISHIVKTGKDIIIAAAHSRWGFWYDYLSERQKKIINEKCDLVLSGTTHCYAREVFTGMEHSGPLILNAGSPTLARFGSPNGYLQVHVMEHPLTLVVQYHDVDKERRTLNNPPYAFFKVVDGSIREAVLHTPQQGGI